MCVFSKNKNPVSKSFHILANDSLGSIPRSGVAGSKVKCNCILLF